MTHLPKKNDSFSQVCLIPYYHLPPTMSPIAALRTAARVGPARLVAGMRVSLAARPMVARMAPSTMTRAFSASAGRFGSGTSECLFACSVAPARVVWNSHPCVYAFRKLWSLTWLFSYS